MRPLRSGSQRMRWSVQDLESERDEALVERAQAGEAQAMETLMRRHMNMVRARARGFFLVGGDTDDLVQEGMIGLYGAIGSYRPDSGKSFKNFAYLCVTRHILDAVKRSGRRKDTPLNNSVSLSDPVLGDFAEEGSPEDLIIDTESQKEFKLRLMRELSDFEFRVVSMYLEGMSYMEICEATGRNTKSIDNALSRSKKKLQKFYSAQS